MNRVESAFAEYRRGIYDVESARRRTIPKRRCASFVAALNLSVCAQGFRAVATDGSLDGSFKAFALNLPTTSEMYDAIPGANPVLCYQVRLLCCDGGVLCCAVLRCSGAV